MGPDHRQAQNFCDVPLDIENTIPLDATETKVEQSETRDSTI